MLLRAGAETAYGAAVTDRRPEDPEFLNSGRLTPSSVAGQLGCKLFVHDQSIDESESSMMEGTGKSARHREAELLPETVCTLVGSDDQVELHGAKMQGHRFPLRMFAHGGCMPCPCPSGTTT